MLKNIMKKIIDVKKYYEENYTFTPNFKELFEYLKKIKINLIYY